MKKYLFIVILSVFFFKANCQYIQGYCYLWYFGDYAGISFNYDPPQPLLNGAMSTLEACSSMGKGDEIYFYTDGMRVWNREHEVMPNGSDLAGHPSSAQGALSVPVPGSLNLFYIFTTDANENVLERGLRYSVVDIFLDEFRGDVTDEKDILLHPQVAEKIALVPHANNNFFWVIAIQWESNNFLAYLITEEGVTTEPVISTVGFHYDYGPPSPNGNICGDAVGYLKASPDGNKLATVHHTQSKVEIYDFDRSTGVVGNPVTSPAVFTHPYGVAFSPNSRYLYISTVYSNSRIFQIDTHDPDCFTNMTQIASGGVIQYSALELAPNQKIYVAQYTVSGNGYLGVINKPNYAGLSCDFIPSDFYLGGKKSTRGLPQMFYYEPIDVNSESINENHELYVYPAPVAAGGNLFINGLAEKEMFYSIYTIDGKSLQEGKISTPSNTEQIIIGNIRPGMYILNIRQGLNSFNKKINITL